MSDEQAVRGWAVNLVSVLRGVPVKVAAPALALAFIAVAKASGLSNDETREAFEGVLAGFDHDGRWTLPGSRA